MYIIRSLVQVTMFNIDPYGELVQLIVKRLRSLSLRLRNRLRSRKHFLSNVDTIYYDATSVVVSFVSLPLARFEMV